MRSYTKAQIVAQLRKRVAAGEKQIDLAREFGMAKQRISRLLKEPDYMPDWMAEKMGYEKTEARFRKVN